jgi:hypothetical protein
MAEDEHRDKHRSRVLKGATILTGMTNSEVKCMLRNMHAGSAELKVSIDARDVQHAAAIVRLVDC